MKKLLLNDTLAQYSLDKVSCFERPIVNVLNYYTSYYGNYYLILSKLCEIYKPKDGSNHRRKTFQILEKHLGIRIDNNKRTSLMKSIIHYIDNGIPVIVGGDLIKIYYANQYMETCWPHWFLITGYDKRKKILNIIDFTQFMQRSIEYEEFYITEKMLKDSYKEYLKHYDSDYAFFILEKPNSNISIKDMLTSLFDEYMKLDIDDENQYAQYCLLTQLSDMLKNQSYIINKELIEATKRKLINGNKYREVFLEELELTMSMIGIKSKNLIELKELKSNMKKKWDIYITKSIVELLGRKNYNIEFSNELIEIEHDLKKKIIDYKKYLDSCIFVGEEGIGEIQSASEEQKCMENNDDRIILCHDESVLFIFHKNKTYNWWFEDEAPKIIMLKENAEDKKLRVSTKISVKSGFSAEKFQAGIFVRRTGEIGSVSLFGAVDQENNVIFDEIGSIQNLCQHKFQGTERIYMDIYKDEVIFGIADNEDRQEQFRWYFNEKGKIEIGFACKTWGKSGTLEVKFLEYNMEYLEEY